MTDALLGALLEPWLRRDAAGVRPPFYHRLPIVRRAEEFMRAQFDQPLMLHDICLAARASERAVEYAFHEVYGVGAKSYLKLLQLARVRRELLRARSSGEHIRDIAGECGFWHMGHFSTAYRADYGETSRETVQRGASE